MKKCILNSKKKNTFKQNWVKWKMYLEFKKYIHDSSLSNTTGNLNLLVLKHRLQEIYSDEKSILNSKKKNTFKQNWVKWKMYLAIHEYMGSAGHNCTEGSVCICTMRVVSKTFCVIL